jgi:hypothetical protein
MDSNFLLQYGKELLLKVQAWYQLKQCELDAGY